MNSEQILDIFYSQVVPEAQTGKVDCYFMANITFNLTISNEVITKCEELPYEGILIPTLKITDKLQFDSLLVEYVQKALAFYSPEDFAFLNTIESEDEKRVYQIKYVICTLFANASVTDFGIPLDFLEKRIAMFDHPILSSPQELDLGYYDNIKASIYIKEEKSPIKAETPYRITGHLVFDDGYTLTLPEIYAGSSEEKHYLYGIQKTTTSDEIEERPYLKQIRKGLIAKINGAPEHYFLAAMLFLSLCSDKEIEITPFLIERWNAKRIALIDRNRRTNNMTIEEIGSRQESIQSGITDTMIRYFSKLEDVTDGIEFTAFPYEFASSLHIIISDDIKSRSTLFNEVFKTIKEYRERESDLKR